MFNNPKQAFGFTLLELLIVIGIVGVLMGMAVPSFRDMMRNNRLTTYTNELVTTLNFARSEAVKRGVQVTILRKGNSVSTWENGWDVFVDNIQTSGNVAGVLDGADTLLRSYPPIAKGYTIRTGANYSCWLSYTGTGTIRTPSQSTCNAPANGGSGFTNDTFRVCDDDVTTNKSNARAIAIIPTGRARTTKGTASCP